MFWAWIWTWTCVDGALVIVSWMVGSVKEFSGSSYALLSSCFCCHILCFTLNLSLTPSAFWDAVDGSRRMHSLSSFQKEINFTQPWFYGFFFKVETLEWTWSDSSCLWIRTRVYGQQVELRWHLIPRSSGTLIGRSSDGCFFFFHSKVMDIWWKWMTLQTERTRSPNLCVPLNYFNQVHAAMTNRVWQLSNSATYFGSESGSLMVIIGWVRQTHTWKSAGVNQSHRVCFLD